MKLFTVCANKLSLSLSLSLFHMSLSLFHKFVEIRACGRQRTSPDLVFWLKLFSVLGFKNNYNVGNSFAAVCSRKNQNEILLPANTDQRNSVPLTGHPLKIESETLQLSSLQHNQLFTKAIHFTMNLTVWHLETKLCFYTIVRRVISIQSG